ncbi:Response regulator receiver domain [Rubrobacter radiotolerans]|uniref:Response regulator n=1 Tax=Rubrobacter radiotolerans TaxID=42256 RepID=A0A023X537_RUBRA|nr:response regulator [Rubrobacter radiotolerans]AHY47184.1 Response regulator receiver domain [Rubrobacter radiotolerans]MDX5894587.1 response regulator [Rubrobacter radiotolerans]SMC06326.1 Response regulator receiver domain-containing protein [Rubrobacter radiotolerans DSM 5868]
MRRGTPSRILLVEDDPNDVELTLSAFRRNKITNEIVVLRDGAEALAYLQGAEKEREAQENPALILLDLKLPKVNGLEVLAEVKKDPRLKSIPTVMLTSSREESDLARSYALGANAYVVKPVDFHDFVEAVREIGLFWAVLNQPPPNSPLLS